MDTISKKTKMNEITLPERETTIETDVYLCRYHEKSIWKSNYQLWTPVEYWKGSSKNDYYEHVVIIQTITKHINQ